MDIFEILENPKEILLYLLYLFFLNKKDESADAIIWVGVLYENEPIFLVSDGKTLKTASIADVGLGIILPIADLPMHNDDKLLPVQTRNWMGHPLNFDNLTKDEAS